MTTAIADTEAVAQGAGLVYVTDDEPGYSRRRCGNGFVYLNEAGDRIGSERVVARIKALAIPPAWEDVWVCPSPRGHLQATGRDDRGRKQYRYHDRWREVRDAAKFDQMAAFGDALPHVRAAVDRDLRRPVVDERRVLALVTRLLDVTLIRVGNTEYFEENGSVGLTTMQSRHARVNGASVVFAFPGKGGQRVTVGVDDPRVARAIRRCEELPGQHLFQYLDDEGHPCSVTSTEVNGYLRDVAPDAGFTAKDFRTWGGSVEVVRALGPLEPPADDDEAAPVVLAALDQAAEKLSNTRAVCRRCYVHPGLAEAFVDGSLAKAWMRSARRGGKYRAREEVALGEVLQAV